MEQVNQRGWTGKPKIVHLAYTLHDYDTLDLPVLFLDDRKQKKSVKKSDISKDRCKFNIKIWFQRKNNNQI